MASLLERMSLPAGSGPSVGPVRAKSNRAAAASAAAPYNRKQRPPKADVNDTWKHDMFGAEPRSLATRLTTAPAGAPKLNLGLADRALREATGEKGFSIKGASSRGNVVQVSGLAKGTTAADVEAIFKRCGAITSASLHSASPEPVVRLTYKNEKDAQGAVAKFHGQPADGRTLEVKIVGGVNATLSGRIGAALVEGSVDVLMGDDNANNGSKLRSDELLSKDSRAHILVAPPGADPKDYVQKPARGNGRGRGRGRSGRGRRGGGKMDVDR
ncbi:uncharacterized protein TRAVEDRAFT_31401 [Trametes versicolor FP-101664 SS1]|uniref:uncharacterized protein n=1 Tax=Trametes versicolor (strain FP-101664) TaxID=717944 RepID=UPI00046231F1|nr:uncharacterized protein TRAVEDRAFT_31401 [Trametes versicolor FP-101664 SS1]EIW54514.1 hypothetical protein TRAVEDRAFT_31401 [Trametes versicolor FP-101664 SS1]